MYVRLGDHGRKEDHVIDALCQVRHEVAHPFAALPVLFPVPRGRHNDAGVALEQLHLLAGVEGQVRLLDERGLVVEGIDLAGGSGHEQLDDALGLGRMVQTVAQHAIIARGICAFLAEHMRKRNAAQAAAVSP